MVNWSGLAARKYNIMQQQADTAAAAQQNMGMVQSQQARLLGVQAGLLPATAGAQARYTNIQADKLEAGRPHWARQEQGQADQATGAGWEALGQGGATMQMFNTQATEEDLAPYLAATRGAMNTGGGGMGMGIGMRRGGSAAIEGAVSNPSRASFVRLQDDPDYMPGAFAARPSNYTLLKPIKTAGFEAAEDAANRRVLDKTPTGMKKGVAKVPGKGDGTKDTVSAKLAPGEAVLNKAAAEHMGRGLIEVLNKMGAEKMGLVPVKAEGSTQNFAAGTEEVQPLDDVRGSSFDEYTKRLFFGNPAKYTTDLENTIADRGNNARMSARNPRDKGAIKPPR